MQKNSVSLIHHAVPSGMYLTGKSFIFQHVDDPKQPSEQENGRLWNSVNRGLAIQHISVTHKHNFTIIGERDYLFHIAPEIHICVVSA